MSKPAVRRATAPDAQAIIAIHSRSIRALYAEDYREEQLQAWIGKRTAADMVARFEMHEFFIAVLEGLPIGYAGYSRSSGELLSVFVDPDHARQGVATLMVQELLARARGQGMPGLWLDSSLMAVPFYESVGFISVAETTHAFGDVFLEGVRMEMAFKD
jgi:putative acetyltransferase